MFSSWKLSVKFSIADKENGFGLVKFADAMDCNRVLMVNLGL